MDECCHKRVTEMLDGFTYNRIYELFNVHFGLFYCHDIHHDYYD